MRSFERKVVDKVENYIKNLPDSGMEVLGKRIGLRGFEKLKEKLSDFNFQPHIDINSQLTYPKLIGNFIVNRYIDEIEEGIDKIEGGFLR